jgi:hypothetical protein
MSFNAFRVLFFSSAAAMAAALASPMELAV